jgi:hypothetical protein
VVFEHTQYIHVAKRPTGTELKSQGGVDLGTISGVISKKSVAAIWR